MPEPALLSRSTPAAEGVSSHAIGSLLDRLEAKAVECHSLMIVRRGRVIAEGWWAPYSAESPHLLYSLTKSFTAMAVGLAIADGSLSLDDRIVDVLPDHVPSDVSEQGRRITVHHLLSMTAGHAADSLEDAWALEPDDLVKGFLRVPFRYPEGTRHTYDNATTFILARMVERATGVALPELLDDRLFGPMGIHHAEWDRVASGHAFGFHGLHLTTEAVAAFGELLLRGGRWGDRQLIPREWVDLATRSHIASRHYADGGEGDDGTDFLQGYGYQIWMSRHGFHGNGAFGQHCVVVPSEELVVVVTSAQRSVQQAQDVLDSIADCLLPGIDDAPDPVEDDNLAERLTSLSLPLVQGSAGPERMVTATVGRSADHDPGTAAGVSALTDGIPVTIEPVEGGWIAHLGPELDIAIGHGEWWESAPLGRPVRAGGAWQDGLFVADLYVIRSPHSVRLTVDSRTGHASVRWTTVPLTSPDLLLHLRSPLMTRPDVS